MSEKEIITSFEMEKTRKELTEGRPWYVELMKRLQEMIKIDKARYNIIKRMTDGEWHDLTSLWRSAKKARPIGIVGVGIALNSIQEQLGISIFENDCGVEGTPGEVDSNWKIKDVYMGIVRAAITSLEDSMKATNESFINRALPAPAS